MTIKVAVPWRTPKFSEAEHRVLTLMIQGMSDADIGRELFISRYTVNSHARAIFHKLGVNNRVQVTLSVVAMGLVNVVPADEAV